MRTAHRFSSARLVPRETGEERVEVGAAEATVATGRIEGGQATAVRPLADGALGDAEIGRGLAKREPFAALARRPPPRRTQRSVAMQGSAQSKNYQILTFLYLAYVAILGQRSDVVTVTSSPAARAVNGSSVRTSVWFRPGRAALSSARPIARPAKKTTARTARRADQRGRPRRPATSRRPSARAVRGAGSAGTSGAVIDSRPARRARRPRPGRARRPGSQRSIGGQGGATTSRTQSSDPL